MNFVDDENPQKLKLIGKKVELIKDFREDILAFLFVTKDERTEARYEGAQETFEVLEAYIRGDSPDAIGEAIFQSDGEPVVKLLKVFGIDCK